MMMGALRTFTVLSITVVAFAFGPTACGDGGSDGGSGSDGTTGATISGSCDTDPLKTGITAQQTGVSADAFDCEILKWSAKYNEPDPMIFKAIMYGESRFDNKAIACTNMPCGTPNGWSADETGCYGLMQIVPACGGSPNNAGILANGHPDLATDPSSSDWGNSVFNPDVNIEIGIAGLNDNRMQVEKMFPGCTDDQYTMMAVGNYANYGSTKGCTSYNTDYINMMLVTYKQYAAAANYPAHNY